MLDALWHASGITATWLFVGALGGLFWMSRDRDGMYHQRGEFKPDWRLCVPAACCGPIAWIAGWYIHGK